MNDTPHISALTEATQRAGGQARLAKLLGVTRQAVCQWKRVPADRVREIERLTGVPREVLRPDLFGAAQ
jgi:DNA-binding transcriptional regulator YdaS (Cro superfamily)